MNENLTLPESLILLALNDDTGERKGNFVDVALAGAGLAELAVRGILKETGNPPNRFTLAMSGPTGDAFLDGCMAVVQEKGGDAPPKKLIQAIAREKDLVTQLLGRLVDRGILQARTKKVFLFFDKTIYPEAAPEPERALKGRLAGAMFRGEMVSAQDTVLIALARQTGLLPLNFDKTLLKQHKARIDDIANGRTLATSATAETISSIQTAIMVAVIVPVLVS